MNYIMIDTDGKTYEVENEAGKGFYNQAFRGNLKIVKTSSDGKVEGFSFRIVGDNYDKTFQTDANGEIFIENLRVGKYTVTEVEDSVSAGYKRPDPVTVELVKDETLTVNVQYLSVYQITWLDGRRRARPPRQAIVRRR